MYALTTATGVDAVGPLPRAARRLDTGQWVTPPPNGWTDTLAAECGWLPVVESPRPADTATDTHEPTYTRNGATVIQTWTTRPWTADELAAQSQQAVAGTLTADTKTDLDKIAKAIADLATLLGDAATVGSVRAVMGTSTDAAGTGTLRALRAQTNTDVVTAASIKALIRLVIDLAQRVIDTDQATRKIARQTLRLAKLTVGDLSSADVGADL